MPKNSSMRTINDILLRITYRKHHLIFWLLYTYTYYFLQFNNHKDNVFLAFSAVLSQKNKIFPRIILSQHYFRNKRSPQNTHTWDKITIISPKKHKLRQLQKLLCRQFVEFCYRNVPMAHLKLYANTKEIERFLQKHNIAIKQLKRNASALAL